MNNYDVIVIGGGIAGLSTSYHLSEMGYDVLLLEKNTLASGSTGRCLGGVRNQFVSKTKIQIMKENIKFYSSFESRFGMPIGWFNGGYLILAHENEHIENLEKSRNYCNKHGIKVDYLSSQECREIVPDLNIDGLRGGNYCKTDGQVYPFKVVSSLAELSKNNGVEIKTHMGVVDIETGVKSDHVDPSNKIKGVVAKGLSGKIQKFQSNIVVNATGSNALEISNMVGLTDIPFWNERHEVFVTEPTKPIFDALIIDQRVMKPFSENSYFMQTHNTNQIIGCFTPLKKGNYPNYTSDYPNFLTDCTTSSREFMIEASKRVINLIPKLKNIRIRKQWAGLYPMTYTGCPILDKTMVDGFYLAIGFCGHGLMLGPTCGKLMAELVSGKKTSIDISDWSLENARFLRDHGETLEKLG